MAIITGQNNGSLVEVMAQKLFDLKAAKHYLTANVKQGGAGLKMMMANNRGARFAYDGTRNVSGGFMNPSSGNLAFTDAPVLDNMTANLQYMQFGQEVSGLQLANSAPGMHVGATAKQLAARKILERQAEFEEHFFCAGTTDGKQTIAIPTTGVSTTINTAGVLTCAGTGDGLGGYLLGTGQYVRVVNSSYVFKHSGYITGKTSNTVLEYTPDTITTTGILTTDFILPQSDSASPTTAGPKSLRYLINSTGTMFDKTNQSILAATIDSTTTTPTRTAFEALWRNIKVRNGKNPNLRHVCGEAQMSNYYVQFYAQNAAQVHVVGNDRPNIDLGGAKDPDGYTIWGQPIDSYDHIHPANWWMLDCNSFTRLTLKDAGAMLTPAGEPVQKVGTLGYYNAQVSWTDDYLEYLSTNPAANGGFTALAFSGLPGMLVNSKYTGSAS